MLIPPLRDGEASPHEPFYTALGEFHYRFASLESHFAALIRELAMSYAQAPPMTTVIAATMGGGRFAPLRDTIKRLLRVLNMPNDAVTFFNSVSSQAGEIEWVRNRLAHHLTVANAAAKPPHLTYINLSNITARERDTAETVVLDVGILKDCVADLQTIIDRTESLFSGVITGEGRIPLDTSTPLAWRYKPSALARHRTTLFGI